MGINQGPISLDQKYTQGTGHVFLTGIQALVRLPMAQIRRDRANGLNTAGYTNGTIYIVTGLILLAAVTLDTIARRLQVRSGR